MFLSRFTKTQNIASLPVGDWIVFLCFCRALLRRKILRLYLWAIGLSFCVSVALYQDAKYCVSTCGRLGCLFVFLLRFTKTQNIASLPVGRLVCFFVFLLRFTKT